MPTLFSTTIPALTLRRPTALTASFAGPGLTPGAASSPATGAAFIPAPTRPWMVIGIAEYRYQRNGAEVRPFCVGEVWDSDRAVDEWLESVNAGFMDNPVSAFDFPLHYKLKGLCDQYGFDVRSLGSGTVIERFPSAAVTFVDNHDTVRDAGNAVINDKMLAYAVVLTGEGYPCVF